MATLGTPAIDDGTAGGGVHALEEAMPLDPKSLITFTEHWKTFKKRCYLKTPPTESQPLWKTVSLSRWFPIA